MSGFSRCFTIFGILLACVACHKGDPTFACNTNGVETRCSVIPAREKTSVMVHVAMVDASTCKIDARVASCSNVGATIRSSHPLDDPTIAFCAGRTVTYRAVGQVVDSIFRENLPFMFDCPSDGGNEPTSALQPNNRFERSRDASSVSQGGSR